MTTHKPLVNFHASEELIERLNRWRFKNMFESRAEAIRWLIEYGIENVPTVKPPPKRTGD